MDASQGTGRNGAVADLNSVPGENVLKIRRFGSSHLGENSCKPVSSEYMQMDMLVSASSPSAACAVGLSCSLRTCWEDHSHLSSKDLSCIVVSEPPQ